MYIRISENDRVTYNRENTIILNNAEQHILKDTIAEFGFGFKILKLCLYIIEYRANPMYNPYRAFKKAKAYFGVLNAKVQMQKEFKLKSGYKTLELF